MSPTARAALLAAALLLGACSSAATSHDEGAPAELGRPFTLRVGQTASVVDPASSTPLRVTFVGVTDDSRCGEDVQCVWEGDARLALRLRAGAQSADTAAHTSARFTPDPVLAGYRVSVAALAPRARTDRAIAPSAYVATLRVVRQEGAP